MKKNLLIAALAVFGCANIYAQDGEKLTETLSPTADTYLRYDNTAKHGAESIIEIHSEFDGEAVKADFVGLMQFNIPAKPGYDVSKATLVVYANTLKGSDNFSIYPYGDFTEDDIYADHAEAIAAARGETPLVPAMTLNGWGNHAMKDVVPKNGDEKYKDIDSWKTEIELPADYVNGLAGGKMSLLLDNNYKEKITLFSKDADDANKELTSITETGFELKAEDVKPYMLVEYTKNGNVTETVTPNADTYVRNTAETNSYGDKDQIEIWTSTQADGKLNDFVGLMQFALPERQGDIVKATLVLHAKMTKGDRTLDIYPFAAEISDGDNWNDQSTNIDAARKEEPLYEGVVLNGKPNANVIDIKEGETEWTNVEAWETSFDLTDYVKGIGTGNVGLMFTHDAGDAINNNSAVMLFSKEAVDIACGGVTFNADDIRPKLVVEYSTASGIDEVETGAVKAKEGIYTLSGVRVAKADQPGIYIINGKKVLVRNK